MLLLIFLFLASLANISSIDAVIPDFYWRDYIHGDIPCDAYEGAPGRYVGQVHHNEHNLVGNIFTSTGNAMIAMGNIHSITGGIRILCSADHNRFYWEYVDLDKANDQQLQDAIKGGFQGNYNDPLFVGKTMYEGEWKIGKVHTYNHNANRGLWIWNQQQKPVNIHQFYILKYNMTDACRKQCSSYA